MDQNGDPFAIKLNSALQFECLEDSPQRKLIRVYSARTDSKSEKNLIQVKKGQTLLIHRILSNAENELKFLIQNSGSGLNSNFEGFDLLSYLPLDTPQDHAAVRAICGVCKVVRADVFHQLIGFDPQFFMYYEDTDFSLRLCNLGFKFRVIERAHLRHIHAGSSGAHTPFFARQVAWSLLYFQMRHASLVQRIRIFARYLFNALLERVENVYDPAKVHLAALERYLHGRRSSTLGAGVQ
jgi:hypothetical protein